jgi:glycyl-tRNA synthetase beta chain
MAKNFLIELGTEELPPKALRSLAEAFAANFEAGLKAAGLAHQGIKWYATPRRLALKITELDEGQADKIVEKRGPAIASAFDADGNPTKAAQGWARGNGITVEQAERLKTDKGEWLLHKEEVKGQPVSSLLVLKKQQKRLAVLRI